MKESGLEKLIELLREAYPLDYDYVENNGHICHWYTDETGEYNRYWNIDAEVISKKFGFIKRLVENEKIDLQPRHRIIHIHKGVDFESGEGIEERIEVNDYEKVLMLLSISDTPIDDLVSYLKNV